MKPAKLSYYIASLVSIILLMKYVEGINIECLLLFVACN